jgi:hypothetical protein
MLKFKNNNGPIRMGNTEDPTTWGHLDFWSKKIWGCAVREGAVAMKSD